MFSPIKSSAKWQYILLYRKKYYLRIQWLLFQNVIHDFMYCSSSLKYIILSSHVWWGFSSLLLSVKVIAIYRDSFILNLFRPGLLALCCEFSAGGTTPFSHYLEIFTITRYNKEFGWKPVNYPSRNIWLNE